ncbi:MAG: 3'-5' exonuclease, partial [Ktedonobacteraceae bacterium]
NLYRGSNSVWTLLARYLLLETSVVRDLLEAGTSPQTRMIADDYARLLQYAHTYDQRCLAQQQQAEERARELGVTLPIVPGIAEQVRDFLAYLHVLANLRQESEGKREESDEAAAETPDLLRIMTVHASKGLEFPVVYLPGLVQNRFPSRKQHNPVPPPAGMLAPESEGERAHESGEACLFYVATTRARDQLLLSHSEHYGKMKANRSSYVDALLVDLPAERVRRVFWNSEVSAISRDVELAEGRSPLSQPSQRFIEAMQPSKLRSGHIEEYQRCPRRYAYSNIYAFQNQDGNYLPFWQATSDTLKMLVERVGTAEQPTSVEQVAELFTSLWHEQGGDTKPFAQFYARHGQEIVEQVWRQMQERQVHGWQLRQRLLVQLAGREIEVSIDRIEVSAQGEQATKFVRTRFGKSKSEPKAGTRELLYLHACRQHHIGQDVELEAHNLSTGARHAIKLTARVEQNRLKDVEQAIDGIERHDFTPTQNTHECLMCPFALICPA